MHDPGTETLRQGDQELRPGWAAEQDLVSKTNSVS